MNDMLLKDWAEEWLSTKRDYVKESTYANYIFLMEKHILRNLEMNLFLV